MFNILKYITNVPIPLASSFVGYWKDNKFDTVIVITIKLNDAYLLIKLLYKSIYDYRHFKISQANNFYSYQQVTY